ncbi:hypothetical protein BOX15_Mlig022467g1 [Macrostomum lignano]|uniref:Uncharacterized protein n=2 Tax=Macrostomum lignano TaxID=282301 RepID=A0A267DIL1_9PLAT|nr:hypothetical protein BOX15_Mlig022467g1 [Macrostomum lignano]
MDELAWLLEREYIATLQQLQVIVDQSEKKLAQPASKFLFTPNEQCSLKAVVTLNGDEITEADISVESPFKQFYRCGIAEGSSYKLQQLIGCGSTLQAAKLCIQQACEVGCQSEPARTLETLDRIFACLKSARDHVVLPQKKSVEELAHSRHKEVFHPPVPNDMSLSMYVSGRRLVLAVYFLHYNTRTKSYDISGRYHGQAVVPWLNDLLLHLSRAMLTVAQLIEKLRQLQLSGAA